MKLVKPIKFKKAIRELVEFLDAFNGIQSDADHKSWQEEVIAWQDSVDPKDRSKYLKIATELEQLGIGLGSVWINFENNCNSYNNELIKIHNRISLKK